MERVMADARLALRNWIRSPGFVILAVLSIMVGSGGTTTILSIADALLLRSLPGIQRPGELVEIRLGNRAGRGFRLMEYPTFLELRRGENGLSALSAAGYAEMSFSAEDGCPPEIIGAMAVSGEYFTVLETRAFLGRFFNAGEDREGNGQPVAVLSHSFWKKRFQGDPGILGRTVRINRQVLTVVGVAEEGFHGHFPLLDFSVWVPLDLAGSLTDREATTYNVLTIGRIEPGGSLDRTREAIGRIEEGLREADPSVWASQQFWVEEHTRSYQSFRGPITLFIGFLLGLSGCLLLIACSNVAGILYSRSMGRTGEMAVRRALGAERSRLVQQLLTETGLLFCLGGAGGVVLAMVATRALGAIPIPWEIPIDAHLLPDLMVMALSISVTLAVGLFFGLLPALKATRSDLASVMKNGSGGSPGGQWIRKALIVAQVAATVILLGGSGVLYRALQRAGDFALGFNPQGAHVAAVNLELQRYSPEEGKRFFRELLERAETLPGVESAALADFVFLVSPPRRSAVFSRTDGEGSVEAGLLGVSPSFFKTMEVSVLEGRAFDERDLAGSEAVAMVNETVARILWGEESPVGKTLRRGDELYQVVGLAEVSKYISVGESALAGVFLPHTQHYVPKTSLLLRAGRGGANMAREVQELVTTLDPEVPLSLNTSYQELVDGHFLFRRLAARFAGILGLMGLFLVGVGLYGTLSQMVARRSWEMAVRLSLGAPPSVVLRPVILGGMGLIVMGLALGLPLSVATTRIIRVFLYGMDPLDPVTLVGIITVFVLVGGVASSVPAARAVRMDPAHLLREE